MPDTPRQKTLMIGAYALAACRALMMKGDLGGVTPAAVAALGRSSGAGAGDVRGRGGAVYTAVVSVELEAARRWRAGRGARARASAKSWAALAKQSKSLGVDKWLPQTRLHGRLHNMPAAEKKKLVATADGELGLTMDPSLLRGATADLLIKNRSEIFSSNVLSQKDLAQLHESTAIVSFLHDFFSHSWRTARLDKWAALLLYLNAQAAALALVAGAVFWALLENFGVVPRLLVYYGEDRHLMTTGMPMLVGFTSGVVFLINWQRIRAFFGLRPRYCFLDKVCIDQVNDSRKAAGIASLGAFLGSAENFVVLFSPDYFSRLVLLSVAASA